MQLHELTSLAKRKKIKRIGRGGKRGTYSGHGQKGQRARAGHKIRPSERDLFIRLPKLRGNKNKSTRTKPLIIKVGDLARLAVDSNLSKKILIEKGFIKKNSDCVKILGGGELKKAINLEGLEVSASAKKKIEAAKGKIKL
ncbi:MAG: 50S ribosomal protein L15 [Patescibacteria group bacterium]|nr:50S ribosomal protein L15 [Patescibacteria group bacterium]